MVLEGLKFRILAFETIAHAHDNIFVKYRAVSESHIINKM